MLPTLELRNFWYMTGTDIFRIVFVAIVNLSMMKKKTEILSAPSLLFIGKFKPLAVKNKFFRFFASKFLWAVPEIVLITAVELLLTPVLATNFAKLVDTGGNFFGVAYFVPFILITLFVLFWQNPLKNLDYFTFCIPVELIFMKIGCFCAGCCNSIWWPGGVYNYSKEREELPIQLIESACALLIFIILVVYDKKAKNRKDGELYPLFIMLYSGMRFVSEFWRGQKLVWGPFRYYHLFCAIGIVYGIITFVIVRRYSDTITRYFDNRIYFSRKLKQMQFEKEALKS